MYLTNHEWDTIGDRINATGRLTIQIARAIDRKCEIVHEHVLNALGDYELSFTIARQCEITTGRALWDAYFNNQDTEAAEGPLYAVVENCEVLK